MGWLCATASRESDSNALFSCKQARMKPTDVYIFNPYGKIKFHEALLLNSRHLFRGHKLDPCTCTASGRLKRLVNASHYRGRTSSDFNFLHVTVLLCCG